jgi:hypothetical protein
MVVKWFGHLIKLNGSCKIIVIRIKNRNFAMDFSSYNLMINGSCYLQEFPVYLQVSVYEPGLAWLTAMVQARAFLY